MKKPLDAAFVQGLVGKFRRSTLKEWWHIDAILPVVLFELQALGPEAMVRLRQISAEFRLDDGEVYRLKYSHALHGLTVQRVEKATKKAGPVLSTLTNASTPEQVRAVLHPKAAALAA